MLIDGHHSVNTEPVTNEQPAQVEDFAKALARLQPGSCSPQGKGDLGQ